MGDLNYRINDLAVDTVKTLIGNNHFKELLVQDQVRKIVIEIREERKQSEIGERHGELGEEGIF